ncbi:MAG: hypothetical protein IJD79_10235 [Clostridia bacterium]|nr:hypothetical protein [Clostridia bacterium]
MSSITDIDKNLKVETNIERDGLVFRNANDEPFQLYGIWYDGKQYRRLPEDIARGTNPGVHNLSTNTAGGRLRFMTDSLYIAIKVVLPHNTLFAHMPLTGIAGFDMYVREGGVYEIAKTFIPHHSFKDSYEGVHDFVGDKCLRDITLNFPLYNDVYELYIGLKEGCEIKEAPKYTREKPIVFYGSSITQGGCASRPGNAYTSIVSRKYDIDHINLGFSGNAKGEAITAEYIAKLDMSVFVMDYDHNAPDNAHYERTHEPFFKTVRAANPTLPIIIMTRPKHKSRLSEAEFARLDIARRTYENALAAGDKNVYFIPGYELMESAGAEGCVDFTHPTDYGFFSMAKRVIEELDKILL